MPDLLIAEASCLGIMLEINSQTFMCKNPILTPNEPVGKVLLTSENDVFGGHLTPPKYKIVDCGAFCEVIFFLHLTQESAWGLFLQPQRPASAGAGSIGDPVKCWTFLFH